jgi:hypothetical protein
MNNCKIQYEVHKAIKEVKRTVIIHRHLFKNAGTTFDSILQNNFGNDFCDHREDVPMRKIGEDYLLDFLKENPEIKALSSHHIWFKPAGTDALELIPVLFLRHPIERMRSVYDFERKQDSSTLGSQMAKKLGFRDFALWYMQDDKPATMRDFHARHLAGFKKPKPLRRIHFKKAASEIKTNPFIGVVDLFDESLQAFDKAFRAKGIELDFSYQPKNVNKPFDGADYEKRASEVLEELGEIAKIVLKKNAFDIELYRLARTKILNV